MSSIDSDNAVSRLLALERAAHEAFAASRRIAHVPRRNYLDHLDRRRVGAALPLAIHAPSGAGKSSLVAYWAESLRKEYPGIFVVEHYIGGGSQGDHFSTIRHILLEIRERHDLREEIPSTPEGLKNAFSAWLWYVRDDDPMILIIDALNQLPDHDRDIDWLPEHLPPAVRLVITTTDQTVVDQLAEKGWESISLKPLTLRERQKMVEQFMSGRSTAITSDQARGVAAADGSANPLLLRTRLEEVGRAPRGGEAHDTIAYYLGARDLDELHQRMLARLENEFPRSLVADALSLLHLSRGGLSRAELSRMTRHKVDDVGALVDRLSFHFIERDNRLNYVHEYLRNAVAYRYLTEESRSRELREQIVGEFASGPATTRSAQEVAYQLSALGDDIGLKEYLAGIDVAMAMQESEAEYEFLIYWRRLGEEHDIIDVYRQSLAAFREGGASGERLFNVLDRLGNVLQNVGRLDAARELHAEALTLAERLEDPRAIARSAGDLGMISYRQGWLIQAMEYYQLQYAISEGLGDEPGLATALSRMAAVYFRREDFENARAFTLRRLDISRRLNDRRGIAMSYGGLAVIFTRQGEGKRAMENFEKELEIYNELGDRRRIAQTLGNMGVAYGRLKEYEKAGRCYEDQLRIAEEIGDRVGMASALGHLGNLLSSTDRSDQAVDVFRRQLALARELGDRASAISALRNIATILVEHDGSAAHTASLEWLEEGRETDDRESIVAAARLLSRIEEQRNELGQAEEWMRLAISETAQDPAMPGMADLLADHAILLDGVGEGKKARDEAAKAMSLRSEHDTTAEVQERIELLRRLLDPEQERSPGMKDRE